MRGPARRLILAQGREYTVRNTPEGAGGGGRDTPTYSDDGSVIGVLEQRGMPRTVTDSSGSDIQTDLEIRVVESGGISFHGSGETNYPSKLVHPSGQTYTVVASFPEDSGVTVLAVVRA